MSVWEIIGVVLMPLTYGFAGWLTNTAALHMTLYPLEFVGIWKPYLGWQGVVPRRSKLLALAAFKHLTTHVVRAEEFLGKLKASRLERLYRPVLENVVGSAAAEPEVAERVMASCREDLHTISVGLEEDVGKVLNFRALVVRNVTGRNVIHLIEIFRTIGAKEFRFIRRSGWVFGGLLGLVQVGAWFVFPRWWTLPMHGALVGALTNLLALTMIFRPLTPRRILGFTYQGLFIRRQAEVAEEYARLFAEHVLNPRTVLAEVFHRPLARSIADALQREAPGEEAPTAEAIATRLAETGQPLERLLARGMNVQGLMARRIKKLSPAQFEPLLRTAFREDEVVLIVLGAVFGALVGLAQGLLMLASA